MIFSGSLAGKMHIDMIFEGTKTQTRRLSPRYIAGRSYAVQRKRCAPADLRGRIAIKRKWEEHAPGQITAENAMAEGGYTPEEYENLFSAMWPDWEVRWAYMFGVVLADGEAME